MKLRAFETLQPPPLVIELDASAISTIREQAIKLFEDKIAPTQVPCILEALHAYISARGLTPNFKVIK